MKWSAERGAEIDKYKKSAKAILSACLQYTMEKMLCQDRQKNEGYYAKTLFVRRCILCLFRPGMDRWWPLLQPFGRRRGGRTACRKARLRGIRPAAFRLCRNRAPRGAYTLKSLLSEAAKGIQPHSANCFFIPAVPAAGALQTETAAENPRLPRKKPPTKMAVSLLAPPSIRPAGIQKSLPPQWNP